MKCSLTMTCYVMPQHKHSHSLQQIQVPEYTKTGLTELRDKIEMEV
jgi:hypothetical protein